MELISIELAQEKDLADICLLLEMLFMQEADFKPDVHKQRSAIKLLLEHPEQGHFIVMKLNDKIIGCVNLLYLCSTVEGGKVAILEDMIIDEKFRGQGYGKKLLDYAIEFAKSQSCLRITLLTDRDNVRAQSFYQNTGFKFSSMLPMRLKI